MRTEGQWCLCWSCAQNSIHAEPLGEHLRLNREAYGANAWGDYRLLYIGTYSEVHDAAGAIRNTIVARDAMIADVQRVVNG